MRALTLQTYGLKPAATDMPLPTVGAGKIRVRVKATSINPIDWKQASGQFRPILTARFPNFIPGYDVAGEVEALGTGVTEFSVGQRVHTRLSGNSAGANAEYIVADASEFCAMPPSMDLATAAGLPLAGMTALQALRNLGQMPMQQAKKRVLVFGASGGVGHLAVQLAVHAGAEVLAVCSARNAAWVKALGTGQVIDYSAPGALTAVKDVDIFLDCVGVSFQEYAHVLAPQGRFVSCLPAPSILLRSAFNFLSARKVFAVMLKANRDDLQFLDAQAEAGKLKVQVDSRFPAEKLADAWERSRSGRAAGKIIVEW